MTSEWQVTSLRGTSPCDIYKRQRRNRIHSLALQCESEQFEFLSPVTKIRAAFIHRAVQFEIASSLAGLPADYGAGHLKTYN